MRGDDDVALDLAEPPGHALRQGPVALPAARLPAPLVGFARGEALRVLGGELVPKLALPVAVVDLAQPVVGAIAILRQAHFAAHDLHGLARPHQRARHVVERAGVAPERLREREPVARGLGTAGGVEGDVFLPLVALGEVPIRLAVADEVDYGGRLEHRSSRAGFLAAWQHRGRCHLVASPGLTPR